MKRSILPRRIAKANTDTSGICGRLPETGQGGTKGIYHKA
jgi:hypothetical protein